MENQRLPGAEDANEMSFLDHLEVLRWHLIRSAFAIVVGATVPFIFKSFIFDTVIFGPKSASFITYRVLCKLSRGMSTLLPQLFPDGAICIGQNLPDLQNFLLSGQFTTHIMVAVVGGIIIAAPYIFFEIWRFVSPGLRKTERKMARSFVFFATFLFFSGVLFGYFVICPLSINFLLNYQVSELVANNPTLGSYISLIITIILACGAVFELPLIVYFLSRAGLVSSKMLKAFRRHALVGSLVLSAVITPPDMFSQILVSIPIMILYEISIRISAMVQRKQNASTS